MSVLFLGPHASNPFMLTSPPELNAHKGRRGHSLLYVVGGLLMAVTAGGRCVDAAVRTAQDPANLRRLSHTLIGLIGLIGLRCQIHSADSVAKGKPKRLFFTDSFCSLLDMTRPTLRGAHHPQVLVWFPERQTDLESAGCVLTRRCRIYYILVCGESSQSVWTLCVGSDSYELKTYNPSNRLRWLIDFNRRAQARGDVIFLSLAGQTGQMTGRDTNDASNERRPTCLTLGLSVLSAVLLWMFLPHIAVCAVICLGWKLRSSRALQRAS